jgi:putative membrane protein
MFFKQASSVELKNKKSIKIPGCTEYHVGLVTDELYNNKNIDYLEFFPVEKAYLYRAWLYQGLAMILVVLIGIFLHQQYIIVIALAVGLYLMTSMYFHYHKTKYGFNNEMIRINGGTFGDKATILPIHKIQAVKLRQSPYQQRKGLANLVLYTASGGTAIPYLKLDIAQKITNYFLYRIESDRRKWM